MVEREWVQAGHPFRLRCARSGFGRSHHGQESPLFTLFLDCTWQVSETETKRPVSYSISSSFYSNSLVRSNSMSPSSFNYSRIVTPRNSVRGKRSTWDFHFAFSRSGTFIFNNEKEKLRSHGMKKTVSLWSYLNRPEILRTFLNPFYEPNVAVLWPSVAPQSIVSRNSSSSSLTNRLCVDSLA